MLFRGISSLYFFTSHVKISEWLRDKKVKQFRWFPYSTKVQKTDGQLVCEECFLPIEDQYSMIHADTVSVNLLGNTEEYTYMIIVHDKCFLQVAQSMLASRL